MATILQRQLAEIAANSTHQLDLKAQKSRHGQSLLFEPRDAASQSFDTIFQLCREGFEELCQLDGRFAHLGGRNGIFSENSKEMDRTQLTAGENEELDHVLENALGLLQGRLLLRPAIKCVEWLIRRFRIHEYNIEATLLAFLPYHVSDMFPTLLSILSTQHLPVTFKWLHPYMASLQSPPRSAVLSAITSNAALFAAFNGWVMRLAKARQHSAILLGFWASLTAQAVNGMIDSTGSGRDSVRQQREEDLLLCVLPVLQEALSVKSIPELFLGGCMVIAILVTKTQLQEQVLEAIMETITGAWSESTLDEGLTCLALVAEEKDTIDIPSAVVRELSKWADIPQRLTAVGHDQRVSKLIAGLAQGAAKAGCKAKDASKIKLATNLLKLEPLQEQHAISALRDILTRYAPFQHDSTNIEAFKSLSDALDDFSQDDTWARVLVEAARNTKFDLQALQIGQHAAIEAVGDSGAMDIDEEEVRADVEDVQTRFDDTLRLLSPLPSGMTSFLDQAMPHLIFIQYAAAWTLAHSSEHIKATFLGLETFTLDRQSLPTFLARVWTSISTSTAAKASAIRTVKDLLLAKPEEHTQAQYLLPYALIALSDNAVNVRRAAAGLINALSPATPTESTLTILNDVYGSIPPAKHELSGKDLLTFVRDAVIPVLEDCVLHDTFISRALVDIITTGTVGAMQIAKPKDLKKSLRAEMCSYFAFHAVATPVMPVRLAVLRVLSKVGKPAEHARKLILLPFLQGWIAGDSNGAKAACGAEGVTLDEVDSAMLSIITHRTTDELDVLVKLTSGETGQQRPTLPSLAFARLQHIFPLLRGSQTEIASALLERSLRVQSVESGQDLALDTVRALPLPVEVLCHLVETLPNANELHDQPPAAKKRRHSRSEDVRQRPLNGEEVQIAIRRITTVLELLESSKASKQPQLLAGLFHLLDELHIHKSLVGSELVYLHQMLFSCLISIVDELSSNPQTSETTADKSVIRTDLIVECLRTTKSSQIHNLALLLVSRLASWAPELVLHSVMPLFTFMSSTVLRQTDDYSAHVADETVGKIVPPLAQSLKSKGRDIVLGTSELLLSFVAAYEHVPLHRRSSLFELLTTTLGEENVLFALLAMLTERYPLDSGIAGFVVELSLKYESSVILKAANQYLDLVADGIKSKRGLSEVLLGFNEKSNDQMLGSTETLVEGLTSLLQNEVLRSKIALDISTGDAADIARIRTLYADLLNKAIHFTQPASDKRPSEENVVLLLRAVLGLLPTAEFIQSSAQLMQSGSDATRQQVFRSLESRAQDARRGDKTAQKTFIDVLPGCIVYVDSQQSVATRHAAIACIDQISEKFGKTNPETVLAAAEAVTGESALGSDDQTLRIISLLALASMVEVLGDEAIGLLPAVIDKALGYLEICSGNSIVDSHLKEAAFSLLNSVLETLPWMISAASLDRALLGTDRFAGSTKSGGDQQFCAVAARKIVPTELFTAVERTWPAILTLTAEARIRHLQTWRDAIKHSTKATITKNAQLLFRVLLQAFDLRRNHAGSDADTEGEVFTLVNAIAIDLTLKLNDATFRPFFMSLIDWATKLIGSSDVNGKTARLTSVYSFSLALFEQLKSLVTTYATFLSENAAQILREASAENENERRLLETVLQTLSSSFRHDQDDFWQAPAHFDELAAPLVSQLDRAKVIDVSMHVIPTIADLAAAVSSPDLLKSLNTMLMAKTKNSEAAVRLMAVQCERAVTEKLSLEWLTLLPEILPVISELLEDDSEEVERHVLMWIKEIEDITGEDLGAMLS